MMSLNISQQEVLFSEDIFARLSSIPLINKYEAYQLLDDEWVKTAIDLEMIQTEGFETVKRVDPNRVIRKKKDGNDEEVQDGWVGRVIPFELVQKTLLLADYEALKEKEDRLMEITSEYEEILDSLSEEEKESSITTEKSHDAFVVKEVAEKLKEIYADVDTPEIKALQAYAGLSTKTEKLAFIGENVYIRWGFMEAKTDGTYGKKDVNVCIAHLQSTFEFPEDSFEAKIVRVHGLMSEEKDLKTQVKADAAALHMKTKETIESLSDAQALDLLERKWIVPLVASINSLPEAAIQILTDKVTALSGKYAVTFAEVEAEIKETKSALSELLGELVGNEYDNEGLREFKALLEGE